MIQLIQLFNALSPVLVAIMTGVMAIFLAKVNHRIKKDERTDKSLEAIEKNQKTIADNIAAIHNLDAKVDELEKSLRRTQRANTVLLRDSMRVSHKALMEQGTIASHQLSDFEEAYQIYHESGGNGTATKYRDDILTLEIKD